MGLSLLKKIPPKAKRSDLEIDLSALVGEPAQFRFHEPTAAMLAPNSLHAERLRAAFPEWSDEMLQAFRVLGACYIPDSTDQGADAARAFGQLAREQWEVFLHILQRFGEAFPAVLPGFDPEAEKNAFRVPE